MHAAAVATAIGPAAPWADLKRWPKTFMHPRLLLTVPMLGLLVLAGCGTTAQPVLRPVTNAPPANPPGVFDVNKVGMRPIPIFQATPRYPSELQRAGIAGEGVVAFVVGTDGTVGDAVVVSATDARFGHAAVEAIQQWSFRPAQINGTSVRCHMTMTITFTNPNPQAADSSKSVAILISLPGGAVPSPAEIAAIYKVVQPEIERLGYRVAKDTRSADLVVTVRDPVDPLGSTGGRLKLEHARMERLADLARQSADFRRDSERANADMVTEPKE
jgi:TonB family protein